MVRRGTKSAKEVQQRRLLRLTPRFGRLLPRGYASGVGLAVGEYSNGVSTSLRFNQAINLQSYNERFVDDTVSVGVGAIRGVKLTHKGHNYYAIPFEQRGRVEYWDDRGQSLKMDMLRAPLVYSRVALYNKSSRDDESPLGGHTEITVDYFAPTGTPVIAVADGVIIYRGQSECEGKMLKIRHAGDIVTGYMHLIVLL